ncbi:MAG: TIGR03905 family TSCPD domain-containing protein [Oscillospiraceae bacterium]
MNFSVVPKGVCSSRIDFEIIDGNVHNVKFIGGCPGNLKALSKLIEGMSVEEVYKNFSGITCGRKGTSCTDQFAKAVAEATKPTK